MDLIAKLAPNDNRIVAGNTEHTRPENRIIYPALDGIRAIAFLMVFAQHYLSIPWGWSGVDLFFVLSGFLITGILYDSRNDPHRVRNFYVRRSLRIFPLYYAVMLLVLFFQPIAHWNWTGAWLVWPAYLGNFARFIHLHTPGDATQALADFQLYGSFRNHHLILFLGHFWSLCVEEQFYLIWPWVVFWLCDSRKIGYICAMSIPVALALRLAGQAFLPNWMLENEILYRATPFRMDALLLGGLLALGIRGPKRDFLLKLCRYALPVAVMILGLWLFASPFGHIWQRGYRYPDWRFTWGLTLIDLLAGCLILTAIQPRTTAFRFFNLRPLRMLGRLTYGLYVLHDIPHPAYQVAAARLLQFHHSVAGNSLQVSSWGVRLLTACIGLLSTIILASLSYRFLESPFLNLKERWTVRLQTKR